MTGVGVAVGVERLVWRRSGVQRVATPMLVLLIPLMSLGMVGLARSGGVTGPGAAKLADYATGPLTTTHLEACGQILAVAALMAGGFAAAWAFGQPFADGGAGASFGLATPRTAIALARCLVLLVWLWGCIVAVVVLTTAGSAAVAAAAHETFAVDAWLAAARALGAGVLAAGLATPFAAVATMTRSTLATIGVLVGLVAATQVVVIVGGGPWFPYAVPSLWTGTGGADAAAAIGVGSLALTAAVAPAAIAVVVMQWRRLTDV